MNPYPLRIVAGMVLLVAIAGTGPQVALGQAEKKYGLIEKKTYEFKEANKEMEYAQYIPSQYDPQKKYPLIIALHGLGGHPQQFIRTRGLTQEAEKRGYIVAAPMGYNTRGWYGAPVPKFTAKNDDPANLAELSEKDVMNVLELMKKNYNINRERIYLMGHSMGGGGTIHIGLKYADEWAALAPIAPAIFGHRPSELEKIKTMPIILVQGAKDSLVRPEFVRPWAEQMKKLEMTHEYLEVPDGDHGNVVGSQMTKIFDFFDKHARPHPQNPQKK